MSRLFDKCTGRIYAMDTDSIFTEEDMAGKHFELSDGEHSIPVVMDVKGKGDLSFFRAKTYILKGEGESAVGRHGWQYFYEDFLKLADGSITELRTRQDIKHTLFTKQIEALSMARGRWRTKPVLLDLPKIKSLLKADTKRNRINSDSYGLVIEHKNQPSEPWLYENFIALPECTIGYPKLEIF